MSTAFPASAPAADPVFYRTYSRKIEGKRESWQQVVLRNVAGLEKLGKLNSDEVDLITRCQLNQHSLPSGRWLWVGGTAWIESAANFSGAYNCTSTNLTDWKAFALMMDLAMMGSGTGAIIEPHLIEQLPLVANKLNVRVTREIGTEKPDHRQEFTDFELSTPEATAWITVGDSRQGWVEGYRYLLELASMPLPMKEIEVLVDLGNVRPAGERLAGFGGTANPIRLPELFGRMAAILNRAQGRQLTSLECCLLIDEAASVVVAGNIRRSAGMRQFASADGEAANATDNLWSQGEDGKWRIDPERDALRMANHTRVFHTRPDRATVLEAVTKQFYSGEGAIQFAPEAIARSNADLLDTDERRMMFINAYVYGGREEGGKILLGLDPSLSEKELEHRLGRYGLNPCGEILGADFHCNLAEVHLNRIDPADPKQQEEAFAAAALSVATLLHHRFGEERYRVSRELDPIVGVSFTGLFDFFVKAFGVDWLKWWEAGRPDTEEGRRFKELEGERLAQWRVVVEGTVAEYCARHGLRMPNRCTTVQPAGTKSLLTGASSGWHPPKAQRFIRRITFGKNDPVAIACMNYGYNVVPSQSDKDENGVLLDDPFDPRCTEWLVEIPTAVDWADVPGADEVDLHNFSALAQFDFYMQVQKHYTAHNTSATIEYRKDEIDPLADRICEAIENDEGYISAALLARFDDTETFPRLPFEPISREVYEELMDEVDDRRILRSFGKSFGELLAEADAKQAAQAEPDLTPVGPAGCDGSKCLMPEAVPA